MFKGIVPIDRNQVPKEIIAGISLACLAIPEVMGYTKISGTPVITGMYTILIPALLYAIFGSSRHLVVGADSATAAILASGLAAITLAGPADYMAMASLLALMSAALLLIARFFKLGFLADFLSRSVLIGFMTGVGVQVALSDFPGLFGVHAEGQDVIGKFVYFLTHLGQTDVAAVLLSVIALAAIVGAERVSDKLPGALIVVISAIFASWAFGFDRLGLHILGDLPVGLPTLGLPEVTLTIERFGELAPIALSMFVVILAQSAATSRAYADRYNEPYDADADLVGLAAANIGAGLSGTFVVNGSPTKTEMLDSAGGRTQLAQIAAVATVFLVLVFLTRPLAFLPEVILSVIVFLIGVKLINIKGMRVLYTQARNEFWLAVVTCLTVVVFGVKEGILLALVLSILDHIQKGYRPKSYVLTQAGSDAWNYEIVDDAQEFTQGLVVYHFTHSLYYANVQAFVQDIERIESRLEGRLKWLCAEASAIGGIDYTSATQLVSVAANLRKKGVTLVFCDVGPDLMVQMQKFGLVTDLGEGNFYSSPSTLLRAFKQSPAASGTDS